MEMAGSVGGKQLCAALEMLGRAKSTGVLTIQGTRGSASIGLLEGGVVFATSTNVPRLGEMFAERGLIEQELLDQALRMQRRKKDGGFLGSVLSDLGLVSREAAELFVEEQITKVLQDVLDWEDGEYRFDSVKKGWDRAVLPDSRDIGQYLVKIALGRARAADRDG